MLLVVRLFIYYIIIYNIIVHNIINILKRNLKKINIPTQSYRPLLKAVAELRVNLFHHYLHVQVPCP